MPASALPTDILSPRTGILKGRSAASAAGSGRPTRLRGARSWQRSSPNKADKAAPLNAEAATLGRRLANGPPAKKANPFGEALGTILSLPTA